MPKPPKPISFPRDHQIHDSNIEWWYLNGHLKDEQGKQYSFMDCLFKTDPKRMRVPYLHKLPHLKLPGAPSYAFFAHSIVADIKKQVTWRSIQNVSYVSRDSFQRPLLYVNYFDPLSVSGYVNHELAQLDATHFHIKTELLDLELVAAKPALLIGGTGFIKVCNQHTYYYSLTDFRVSGMITVDGQQRQVSGRAWLDHQWADFQYSPFGWSWFCIQLENGTDLMCIAYTDKQRTDTIVSTIDARGKQQHARTFTLTPGKDVWRSSKTKALYPQTWQIDIPSLHSKFAIKSTLLGQEMIFGPLNYWEGPTQVTGMQQGKPLRGVGFMELVGYPSDYSYLKLVGNDVKQKVQQRLHMQREKLRRKVGF